MSRIHKELKILNTKKANNSIKIGNESEQSILKRKKKNYTCLMYLLKEKFKVISLKREQIIIFYLIRMRKDIIKELRGNKY